MKRRRGLRPEAEPQPHGPRDGLAFVDAHVHLNDVDMARSVMGELGVRKAIVFWGRDSSNASIREAANADPGTFVPFYSVSPERDAYRESWDAGDTTLLGRVDTALGSGQFVGIGELSVTHFAGHGFPEAEYGPLHPLSVGLFELAKKHGVPVTIHCEVTAIESLVTLLRRFESVPVLWAHGGYTPYAVAKRMLAEHPNLTYELSARTWRHHPRSPEYTIYRDQDAVWPQWLQLIEDNPERFVVGTDAALHSIDNARAKIGGVQRLLEQLTPATRARVASGNIERLLTP